MNFQLPDLTPMIPELLLTAFALIVILIDLLVKKKEAIAIISMTGVALIGLSLFGTSGETFGTMFISDSYSTFFKLIFFINVILTILISIKYIAVERMNYGEYYSLILFATIGMMIMASAGDLIVLYLGLELMALSTYILAGFIRHDVKSNEAALKYFLLGAFSSAFLLYGISIVYGLTGTTDLKAIAGFVTERGLTDNMSLLLSVIFLVVAFGFKIAAAPFHMWAPDVYEGAPTSVTAFMSVGPKAAGFAVLGRVFMIAFVSVKVDWVAILIPISILTMAVGNIVALAQTNIKRMLAYSSIAHAGYALIGIITANSEGLASMMNYLMIYTFMNIGAFAVIIMLRSEGFRGDSIYDYEGLGKTHPLAAMLMLIFMFSLTGIPPTAGFIGKLYIFMSAINAGYTWLVVVAVIFSAISAYFYLRIIMYMYMREPKTDVSLTTSFSNGVALALTAVVILVVGVFPTALVEFAKAAVKGF
ncbi:MAG: NADH-quinone oxidoreductase subunit N [Nitrospirota bacterium]